MKENQKKALIKFFEKNPKYLSQVNKRWLDQKFIELSDYLNTLKDSDKPDELLSTKNTYDWHKVSKLLFYVNNIIITFIILIFLT